ncbi:MAG: hypothetical protein M1828_005970 [Chrysothrix sp. TS-e1954]|nr:MAG: hypothetical protein M1828_005970 [Chrysothrix sp. TS-e1954]
MPRPPRKKIFTASNHATATASQNAQAKAAPTPSKPHNAQSSVAPTPGSVLSLANFKRRPRQPSLLHMVQQAKAAESGDESLAHGRLGHGKKAKATEKRDSEVEDVSYLTLPRSSSPVRTASPAALKERGIEDSQVKVKSKTADLASSQSRKRKRGSEDKENRPPSPKVAASPEAEPIPISSPLSSSQLGSPPPTIHATSKTAVNPKAASKKLRTPSAPRRKPAKESDAKERAASVTTASLQMLMPKRRTRRELRRKNDEFEILDSPSSHGDGAGSEEESRGGDERDHGERDEDVDELSLPARKGRYQDRSRKSHLQERQAIKNRPSTKKKEGAASTTKGPGNTSKPSTTSVTTARPTPAATKTYARLSSSSDKENWLPGAEDPTDDSTQLTPEIGRGNQHEKGKSKPAAAAAEQTDEMKVARKKFADVDDWDLSFESADIGGGGSSSPWR